MARKTLLFWILLAVTFGLACWQGYWRHDAWIYTDSELHEIGDGKWLAQPFHQLLHGLPPELSLVACLGVLALFLWRELQRIGGVAQLPPVVALILSLSLFSPSVLSQLQWPTHALAASVPLLLSLLWRDRPGLSARVGRAVVVCFGSLSILSSFAFLAPLCLLPTGVAAGQRPSGPGARRDALVLVVATPALLLGSYALVSLIKRLYFALGVPTAPGRLESVSTTNYLGLWLNVTNTLQLFWLRQWGHLGVLIPVGLLLLVGWALRLRSWSSLQLAFVAFWILLLPILSVVGSSTGWQRVAITWCVLPPLLAMACNELKPAVLRKAGLAALVAASASSTLIGFRNAAASAIATRYIIRSVQQELSRAGWQRGAAHQPLWIVEAEQIDALSPRFIWGGWPAFAISNPENVRFHRVFNELGLRHYVIRHRNFFFHPDVPTRLALQKALDPAAAKPDMILEHYNRLSGSRLEHAATLRLPAAQHN